VSTARGSPQPPRKAPQDPIPGRWVTITAIAGAAGVGMGATAGWPAGIVAGTAVAPALHGIVGH
jgi:hypothetical protein